MGARLQVYFQQHRLMVGRGSLLIDFDPAYPPGDVCRDKHRIKTALAAMPLHLVITPHGGRVRAAGVRHAACIGIGGHINRHRRLQARDGVIRRRAIEITGENAARSVNDAREVYPAIHPKTPLNIPGDEFHRIRLVAGVGTWDSTDAYQGIEEGAERGRGSRGYASTGMPPITVLKPLST